MSVELQRFFLPSEKDRPVRFQYIRSFLVWKFMRCRWQKCHDSIVAFHGRVSILPRRLSSRCNQGSADGVCRRS